MSEYNWVRELTPAECSSLEMLKSGEHLPDGASLLWEHDMDRMGLEELRSWIRQRVFLEGTKLAIGLDRRRSETLAEQESSESSGTLALLLAGRGDD